MMEYVVYSVYNNITIITQIVYGYCVYEVHKIVSFLLMFEIH